MLLYAWRPESARDPRCKVAAGRNDESLGLAGGEAMLGLQAGQLAYRVRARLDGELVSVWSALMGVAETAGTQSAPGSPVQ